MRPDIWAYRFTVAIAVGSDIKFSRQHGDTLCVRQRGRVFVRFFVRCCLNYLSTLIVCQLVCFTALPKSANHKQTRAIKYMPLPSSNCS